MILTCWKDFGTDSEYYTQMLFEKQLEDRFEALYLEEGKEIPSYIWTERYVIIVKTNTRMINDVSFIKYPRNPSSIFF
ncbi:hypothetical protein DX933_06145 [Ornithinibacillus gellani]|uniref:hypothetical protein n=1 Tax=Ornithinibacillus gellani TaxID=2293253 RepID=UPI000F498224|nr:hypothetical protein [Ornithinibacillus gellani]TQS75845.1 hypothetical protein DX933_06145 [Ornithinibacillus gellani]